MPKSFPSDLRLSATHVETGADGAVFRVRVDVSDPTDLLDNQRWHQRVLNAVDAFCQSFLNGNPNVHDGLGGNGMDQFDDWPCDQFGTMPFKYRDLGIHRGAVIIVIADRWLAARLNRAFCKGQEASRRQGGTNGRNWVDYGQAAFRTKTELQLLPDLAACAAERQQ